MSVNVIDLVFGSFRTKHVNKSWFYMIARMPENGFSHHSDTVPETGFIFKGIFKAWPFPDSP